jgi:hypothetical protein
VVAEAGQRPLALERQRRPGLVQRGAVLAEHRDVLAEPVGAGADEPHVRRDALELVGEDGVQALVLARLDDERQPASRGHSDSPFVVGPAELIGVIVSSGFAGPVEHHGSHVPDSAEMRAGAPTGAGCGRVTGSSTVAIGQRDRPAEPRNLLWPNDRETPETVPAAGDVRRRPDMGRFNLIERTGSTASRASSSQYGSVPPESSWWPTALVVVGGAAC